VSSSDTHTGPPAGSIGKPGRSRYRPGSLEIFGAILLVAIALRDPLESLLARPALQSWATVFIAICVQATPFLVLGVVVSGAIAAFVPAAVFAKIMPSAPSRARGPSTQKATASPVDIVFCTPCARTSPELMVALT